MSWGFVRVSMPSIESALLSGWRFGKCVHCATCQFCSWPSYTVSRTVDPHRGPYQGQRTLYSSPQDQTVAGFHVHIEAGGTQVFSVLAVLPGVPAATSFASWKTLGPTKLRTQTSGLCDNQSTLTVLYVKRKEVKWACGFGSRNFMRFSCQLNYMLSPRHLSPCKVTFVKQKGR